MVSKEVKRGYQVKPKTPWNAPGIPPYPLDENYYDSLVVWTCKLDNRYLVEVYRKDNGHAWLRVFDHDENDNLIFEQEVLLNYSAWFGPDIDDTTLWQETVLNFVDNVYTKEES